MSRKKNDARKQFNNENSFDRNLWLAVGGYAVLTPRDERILKLMAYCSKFADLTPCLSQPKLEIKLATILQERRRRALLIRLSKELPELLIDGLMNLDPHVFDPFTKAMDAIKAKESVPHRFHALVLILAESCGFEPGKPLTVTLREFHEKLIERNRLPKEFSYSYLRRECRKLGITFKRAKQGRPPGTRNISR
jgi:hypothetical protein